MKADVEAGEHAYMSVVKVVADRVGLGCSGRFDVELVELCNVLLKIGGQDSVENSEKNILFGVSAEHVERVACRACRTWRTYRTRKT